VRLDIQTGEFVSIAGPSGCRKSTLLSILGLLDSASEGNDWIHADSVENLPLSDRTRIRNGNREIEFVFQAFNLIGDLTVYENVELPLTYRSMGVAERKRRVQGGSRARRHGAPREALPSAAFRRLAAARGSGASIARPAEDSAVRAYHRPRGGRARPVRVLRGGRVSHVTRN
jgi:ABC-type lipoprotein export system ATPase subunit